MKFILVLLFVSGALTAQAKHNLRSLKDVSSKSFETKPEKGLFLFFQKDCQACRKQVSQLECLNIPVFLIGTFSSEKQLRLEYKKMGRKYPGYLADEPFKKKMGVKEGFTPQTVLFWKGKRHYFSGLTSCTKLKQPTQEAV